MTMTVFWLLAVLSIGSAQATGAELGPRGFGFVMVAAGVIAAIQLLTLLIDVQLPRTWSRARRWMVAIVLPPVVLTVMGIAIALI